MEFPIFARDTEDMEASTAGPDIQLAQSWESPIIINSKATWDSMLVGEIVCKGVTFAKRYTLFAKHAFLTDCVATSTTTHVAIPPASPLANFILSPKKYEQDLHQSLRANLCFVEDWVTSLSSVSSG
eukprot:jgi/Psemu1/48124/gm1.48124_g